MERKQVEITLFGTSHDGDLLREYPELAKMEEFKDLDPKQVRFCWLVGNRTSPIFNMDRPERIRRALVTVWGQHYEKNPTIKHIVEADTADGLPEEILKAIHKMNTFSPSYRLKAKLMDEYIFETLNELIVVAPSELSMMDVDDKKKYADLAMKVSSGLGEMVERIESAYGVKAVERKTKKEIQVRVNDLMH
jgi:hypothetical protein